MTPDQLARVERLRDSLQAIEREHPAAGPAAYIEATESAALSTLLREREALRAALVDDAYAITFQTLGQYRTALLALLTGTTARTEGK